ncbi:hypothetical protein POSPLADRAFT_1144209 [Postia placenta MAD-698-R-SB12]|uniref:F-box domain-containing protein n=1 Tax=Postia placenta MAD-698-R-SB12 TaxID=670580 RepID=A0A1X6MZU4_9APHY|nr:hypothetical protein POSPLADRAFT_1144209 [Postia placenta MAD-698-R-SB12]OSX61884.1 hypothetical protein POSPLADRAFT_1144209 [Postia placenta MAD-698-R-SB12]
MATRTVTDLPVELLVMIFFFLDARGLINCKQVCRMFLQLIHGSTSLQYFYELELAGMADEPLCPLPYVERLRKLRSLQHMRRTAELVPGSSFPQWTALVWTTSPGGLFAQADMRGGIEFIQFPSAVLGVSERQWSIHSDQLDMDLETMCMDPSQSVVVVTGWDQVPNEPGGRYPALRILSFTDGQPHALAARSEINLSDTGKYDELDEENRKEGRQSRLEGDYVAHLSSWNYEYAVLVWDWKTGDLLWESTLCRVYVWTKPDTVIIQCLQQTKVTVKYESFDFVDSRHLLATDSRAVDIFVLDRQSEYTGAPTLIRESRCIWDHPMHDNQLWGWPQLMSMHKGGCPQRNSVHPFYSSPERGLVALLFIGSHDGHSDKDSWTEAILVPTSMIREWARRAQAGGLDENDYRPGVGGAAEWGDWVIQYPRVLRAGQLCSAEVQGMYVSFANINKPEGGEIGLRLDQIDYTVVGGKGVGFNSDEWNAIELAKEWDEGGELCVIPADSEGVHSAYAEAQPIDERITQRLSILPDYAILQEYKDVNGDNHWQIYHIVAADSDDSTSLQNGSVAA